MTRPPALPPEPQPQPPRRGRIHLVHTMGTVITLDLRSQLPSSQRDQAFAAAAQQLQDADAQFSTWRADSWISRLTSGQTSLAECPNTVSDVLELATQAEELTTGYFSAHWSGRGRLDPTGLVKGWAAQRASDALRGHGGKDHIVNAAGDIVVAGRPEPTAHQPQPRWRVGIRDPNQPAGLLGVLTLPAAEHRWAMATSGRSERGDHIVDPWTGTAATAVSAATVLAAESKQRPQPGALTDACATALVAAGAKASRLLSRLRSAGFHGLVLHTDGRLDDPDQLLTSREDRLA